MRSPASRTRIPLPRAMLAALALALALAFIPTLQAHEIACAHDTSMLRCLPGGHELSPADTMEKGDAGRVYAAQDLEPGEPGPPPPMAARQGELVQIGHFDPGKSVADVWAHERVAYLGSWAGSCLASGVTAVDLRNPSEPTPLSAFADGESNPALAGSWTEKVIVQRVSTRSFRGDLAAVSFQPCDGGFRGFGLYDVSDPANPTELALVPTLSPFGVHELWLEVRANRAYVFTAANFAEFATNGQETDFMVFDVSDPRNPERISEWGIGAEKGIGIFDGGLNFVHSVIGDGRHAYLSYWDQGTVILDLRDPARPSYVGQTQFGDIEEGNAHSAALAQGGNILIQTDEDFDVAPQYDDDGNLVTEQAWGYPRWFDISDRSNPVQIATFELPTTRQHPAPGPNDYTVHDPKVRGNTAFFSWYAEGVVAVDFAGVRNGRQPGMVAQWRTPTPNPSAPGVDHPWGDDPQVWGVALDGNLILASDMNSGLYVLQLR
jgi:hypothetical protein